jgi:hypothetical protein
MSAEPSTKEYATAGDDRAADARSTFVSSDQPGMSGDDLHKERPAGWDGEEKRTMAPILWRSLGLGGGRPSLGTRVPQLLGQHLGCACQRYRQQGTGDAGKQTTGPVPEFCPRQDGK